MAGMLDRKNTIFKILNWIRGNKVYCVESGTWGGIWTYWKYSDGTFKAIRYSTSGSTGSMTQLSSTGIYYSAISEIPFPSIGITSVRYVNAVYSPKENFIMDMFINRWSSSGVYAAYKRYGSGTAVSNITFSIYIEGTWA